MSFMSVRGHLILASVMAVLASLAIPADAVAQTPVPAFDAEYEVIRNGKAVGSSRVSLRREGDHWRYSSDTSGDRGMAALVGLQVQQHTDFLWLDGQPRPLSSRYEQKATLSNRSVLVRYDWDAGRYHLSDRRGEHEHDLPVNTVDRYGSGIAIATRLAAGEREFELPVAHADGIRVWRFRVSGEETVETTSGRVQALRVERVREDSDRSTISWHDPQRDHIAVRMLQHEDRNVIESRLHSYRSASTR